MITWSQHASNQLQQFAHILDIQRVLEGIHLKMRQFRTVQTEQLKTIKSLCERCGNGCDDTTEWVQQSFQTLHQAEHLLTDDKPVQVQHVIDSIFQELDNLYTVEREIQKCLHGIGVHPENEEMVIDKKQQTELVAAWYGDEGQQDVTTDPKNTEAVNEYDVLEGYSAFNAVEEEPPVEETPARRRRYS